MRNKTWFHAFTLVELLVVIAILGILAGLIMPAVIRARNQARIRQAQADIQGISVALTAYQAQFHYFPPDNMVGNAGWPVPEDPNKCLVFFLGTEFRRDVTDGNVIGGGGPLLGGINPDGSRRKAVAYAPGNYGPGYDFKNDQLTPVSGSRFLWFVDPWGLPYFYNAPGGLYGDPQHKSTYDLFSVGPDGVTAGRNVREMFDAGSIDWAAILGDFKSGQDEDDLTNW